MTVRADPGAREVNELKDRTARTAAATERR
jgi:hypothetical protein